MSNYWIDGLIGDLIGVTYDASISSLILAPLMRIQIALRSGLEQDPQLLQLQQQSDTPALTTFKHMKNNQGVWNLWRGTSLLILQELPASITDFFVGKSMVSVFSKLVTPSTPIQTQDSIFMLTMGTGALCALYLRELVQSPFQVLYTRMALDTDSSPVYSGPKHCLEMTTKHGGSRPLFTGMDAAFVGSLVSNATYIMSREIAARSINRYSPGIQDDIVFLFLSTLPHILSYPFFTVRTRMVAEEQRTGKKPESWVAFMKSMVQNEGVGSLYNGLLFSMFCIGCKAIVTNASRELMIALITNKLATAEASL